MSSDVDLSQFHDIFFEECTEAIATMEAGLLDINSSTSDPELINTIFRAAHSIKGSSGTFGFSEIADFTHGMESMLDELREGKLSISDNVITLLLASVDCLKSMVDSSKQNKPYDQDVIEDIQSKMFEQLEANAKSSETSNDQEQSVETESLYQAWHIKFIPNDNMFYTGNDPLRLIRELSSLGQLEVCCDLSALPKFKELDVERSYLGWNMVLHGDATKEEVAEIFAWVEGDCELEIKEEKDRRHDEEDDRRHEVVKEDEDTSLITGRRKTDTVQTAASATSIRVGIEKVDALVNLVGELVITQSILSSVCSELGLEKKEKVEVCLEQLERHTRELQDQAMSIRMLPVDFAFQRLPRIVHDLSATLNKKVELRLSGESTELDKTVLEKIGDPLVHLVRNALDHGIETPEDRLARGKSETGLITVDAFHQGGKIIIKITDDGSGLNSEKILDVAKEKGLIEEADGMQEHQVHNLIFEPGFSTSEIVSDISGRGVGMDVVKKNISELGGTVSVSSENGKGSVFTIKLPLTLAILEGQMIKAGDQTYIIPLLSIVESIQMLDEKMSRVAGKLEVYQYRDKYIPIIRLREIFGIDREVRDDVRALLVIIDIGTKLVGLEVDEVVGQQQIVIKSLEKNYRQIDGLAGATVLGDGSVALILDVSGLSDLCAGSGFVDKEHVIAESLH